MDGQKEKYNGFIRFYFNMCYDEDGLREDETEGLVYRHFLFFKKPGREYSEHALLAEDGNYIVQIPVVLPEELRDRSWKKKYPELQRALEEKVKEFFPYAMKKYKTFLKGAMRRAETLEKLGPLGVGSHKDGPISVMVI